MLQVHLSEFDLPLQLVLLVYVLDLLSPACSLCFQFLLLQLLYLFFDGALLFAQLCEQALCFLFVIEVFAHLLTFLQAFFYS